MTKITLAAILMLFSFMTKAQSKGNDFAMFAGCIGAKLPGGCYDEKFRDDITSLISPKIAADLQITIEKKYFSISFAFLSAENGKIIPESIEIACENELFKEAIKQYILHLPAFIPKDESNEERRSVHMKSYTFIYNEQFQKYEPASQERLKQENIYPSSVLLGNQPVLVSCANKEAEEIKQCSQQELQRTIAKRISLRSIKYGFTGKIKLYGSFVVEKDGSITITDVICDTDDCEGLKKSFRKALKKMPKFIPADYRGVKVRASYNLPISINITEK
jgi:hypothetical protein